MSAAADRDEAEPAAARLPAEPDPVVDGDAVELPAEAAPPVAPVAPGISEAVPGSGAPAFEGHADDPLIDEIKVLTSERPELIVGAAFAGGILAAMILRRLGN